MSGRGAKKIVSTADQILADVRAYDAGLPDHGRQERTFAARRVGERSLELSDSDRYFQILAKQFLRALRPGGVLVDFLDEWHHYVRALRHLTAAVRELDFKPKSWPSTKGYPEIRPGWREAKAAQHVVQKEVERVGAGIGAFSVSPPARANSKLEHVPVEFAVIRLYELGGSDGKGYTEAEIARILDLSPGKVRQIRRKALRKLKRKGPEHPGAKVATRLIAIGSGRSRANKKR